MQDDIDFGVEPETAAPKRWKDMTQAERRQVDAARKREGRKREKRQAVLEGSGTRDEYWQANRAQLSPGDRVSFEAQQEKVLDQLAWMRYGSTLPESDPDYIPFDEALADFIQFVEDHPCPRTYGWNSSGELSPLWSTEKFWADPKTIELIADEGYATEVWARYGYRTGIEDAKVYFFLVETLPKLGHKKWTSDAANKLIGMASDGNVVRYPKEKSK